MDNMNILDLGGDAFSIVGPGGDNENEEDEDPLTYLELGIVCVLCVLPFCLGVVVGWFLCLNIVKGK